MPASHAEVVLAYRHLSKTLLRATQYSKPARFVTRDHLRSAFRSSPLSAFDAQRISRTIEFAQGAIESTGLEHKIIKNLVHVWWMRQRLHSQRPIKAQDAPFRKMAYDDFDATIERLNESMRMCIK